MKAIDIGLTGLIASYILAIPPLALILWLRLPLLGTTITAIIRMTVQLLLVGFYLDIVFKADNSLLTTLWIVVMIFVADMSIIRGAGLRLSVFIKPIGLSLLVGILTPLFVFVGPILHQPNMFEPQYVIPITGMILGNCLRANIIGIKSFYGGLQKDRIAYQQRIGFGATFREAINPWLKKACEDALTPTIATIATVGLVSLPGMMTGVILGGTDPSVAIKYQIAIMLAILCGTAITVIGGILLSQKGSFDEYGNLEQKIFNT